MVSPLKNSKILKVAGLSLAGFCAVSIGVDKANVGPRLYSNWPAFAEPSSAVGWALAAATPKSFQPIRQLLR